MASRRGMLFLASLSFAAALILLLGLGEWGLDNTPDHEIAPILPMTVGGFVIGLSCFVPVIRGLLKRDIDLFEPIHAYSVSTFVYFVLVP
ncbi:MAG: hypothetical protein P8189_29785, partial [Anaerolineae bacterium]